MEKERVVVPGGPACGGGDVQSCQGNPTAAAEPADRRAARFAPPQQTPRASTHSPEKAKHKNRIGVF